MKQSQKGILKKNSQQDLDMKKELHWDEHTIQQQDLERGNKTKINEPKTPYEDEIIQQNLQEDKIEVEDEIEQDLIQAQLNKQKLQQQHQKKLDIEELNKRLKEDLDRERKNMDDDSAEEEEKRKKHEEFVKKRKQHYNEKNLIRDAMHKKQFEDQ
ncbi:unnamed protein product (macronuclear) [Paramecium tetraurelia]|uniref:Protein phosphatase inhibitor 2 n=1 Tax=Paramecium tetraurelia TaxID=5888 RepID=A0BF93_PARTE|nr:uncharacterized protein GSPATT00028245001 [Paramecium tetraurelia]CAK57210.1 unnamed protein product [Paramecium tetraurelia]|eukprot:XP_001424608.1 hypothetical protein (macronuclear) [Paramecium tetraurelia strain d4-2]